MHPARTYVSFLTLLTLLFIACGKATETATVEERPITESVYASGIIKAVGQYDVYPVASGLLQSILVKEGDVVKKGTPLFMIDNSVSGYNADNARIAMEQSQDKASSSSNVLRELELRLKLSESKYRNDSILYFRQQQLWNDKVGSKVELERKELASKASQTEFEALRNQYQQLKKDLERSRLQSSNSYQMASRQARDFTVTSLMDGTVYIIYKEAGEMVNPAAPVAVVGATGSFLIELQIDEFDIVKVKPGQPVYVSLDSYRGAVFEAVVTSISPLMNPKSRSFTIEASFTNPPDRLYPNLTAEANILVAKSDKSMVIPAPYLIAGNKVLISEKDTVSVKTGISNTEWVEIKEGLKTGQTIYMPLQ